MQNFTLGKKGIPMLLFGLILLTTSFSTYGQENCPTVNDTNQEFCYLATVADLDAQANGDGVRWHRSAASNTAIPENELLQTGIYYAGNNTGNCTNRVSVNVTVDDIGAPTREAGNIFAPCEYTSNVTSTVQNLINTINGNAVEIYSNELSGSPLDPNTILIEGNSYFAGQRNPATNCPSSRLALQYDPILTLAPEGESAQSFCPGATVGDLEAEGTSLDFQAIRWYSTATSFPQLSASTPLIHGETYYASQIANRVNSLTPPCESIQRFEITVTLEGATIEQSAQSFCVNSNDPTTTPQVQDLVSPYGNPFFADSNFTQLLVPETILVDGQDYFTANQDACMVTRVVVDFAEIPNAGNDINVSLCETQVLEFIANPALAIQFFSELIPADIDQTGTFNPGIAAIIAQFAQNPIGTFTSEYTLTNGNCTDSATITIEVIASIPANAGGEVGLTFCSTAGVQNLFDSLGEGANPNGRFVGLENGIFDPSTAALGDNFISFTVDAESGCVTGSDTALYTINVLLTPDAGQDGSIELIRNDPPFNLFSELEGTPDQGGTWSPGNADGSFDPATGTSGNYTYTVTNGTCSDTSIVIVSIIDEPCPIVDRTIQSFCRLIDDPAAPSGKRAPRIRDLTPLGTTWYDSRVETDPSPRNQPLIADHVYYAGNATGTCDNRTRVIVRILEEPSAGSNTTITVCEGDNAIDLIPLIGDDSEFGPADIGGTFSPSFASNSTIFDPSLDAEGQYTYTVDNGLCDIATSIITIEFSVSEDANAGEPFPLSFCTTDEDVNLFTELADGVTMTGTFVGEGVTDGVFSPSTSGEGNFEIIYNVGEDLSCVAGADSATITISVRGVSEAPVADAEQSFCLVNNNTVADLVASVTSGESLVWYENEDLMTVAPATTPLQNGAVFYAVASGEDTCGSPSTMVSVTMNDPDAPTLQLEGNEFCRSDNPTLQDLLDNINGSGIQIYASITGGTPLASTTELQDDVQYFATATDATLGCESSERLAIRVEVNFCGIPEGFSPNGDNINDSFVIPDIAIDFPNYNIEVYNRWGNLVFKGNASTPDWNGISNQSGTVGDGVLPVGVYFYILNYNDGATTSEQGKLYLSR